MISSHNEYSTAMEMTDLQQQAHKHNVECKKPNPCSKEKNRQEIMPGGQGGALVIGGKGARELLSNMLFSDLDAEYASIPSGKIQQAVHQALCPFLYVYLSLKNTFTKYYTIYLMKYKFLIFVVNPLHNSDFK